MANGMREGRKFIQNRTLVKLGYFLITDILKQNHLISVRTKQNTSVDSKTV